MIHAAYACILHPGCCPASRKRDGTNQLIKPRGGCSGWWNGGNVDQASILVGEILLSTLPEHSRTSRYNSMVVPCYFEYASGTFLFDIIKK